MKRKANEGLLTFLWLFWPGRYRMEVEVDPESPVVGQPYAWDLGWVDIESWPTENVIRLPEGEVLRTIRAAEPVEAIGP